MRWLHWIRLFAVLWIMPWLQTALAEQNIYVEAVVDRANVLSHNEKAQLKLSLLELFNHSKMQLAVFIVPYDLAAEDKPTFDFQPLTSINDATAKAVLLVSTQNNSSRLWLDPAFRRKLPSAAQEEIYQQLSQNLSQGYYFQALDTAVEQIKQQVLATHLNQTTPALISWPSAYLLFFVLWLGLVVRLGWHAYSGQQRFFARLPHLDPQQQIDIGIYLTSEQGFPNINPQPKAPLLYAAEQMPKTQLAQLALDLIQRHYQAERSFSYCLAPWLVSLLKGLQWFVLLSLVLAYLLQENPFSIFFISWAPALLLAAATYYYGRAQVHRRFVPDANDAYLLLLGQDQGQVALVADDNNKRSRFQPPLRPENYRQ